MSTENSNLIYVSARASFPWLASPQEQVNDKGEKTYSYSTDLIFPANDPGVAKFMQAYATIAADKWKENAQAAMQQINSDKRTRCYGAGDEKKSQKTFQVHPGYAGNVYITARNTNQPQIIDADGRQIDFEMNLQMSHSQYRNESISIRAGAALKDPLVVNLQGTPVGLQGGPKVLFDLDADGTPDSMARLAQGSAFLALDRNANGRIDDGRELFGALSGDGFADLAAYDEDANGFIDSGDAVFAQLKLWLPSVKGPSQLLGLAEAGIGALGLHRVAGGFDLIADGELQGQVRSTGMFLFEDGRVGSLQQIDLVV